MLWMASALMIVGPITVNGTVLQMLTDNFGIGAEIIAVPAAGAALLAIGMFLGHLRVYRGHTYFLERPARVTGAMIYGAIFAWILLVVISEYPQAFYLVGFFASFGLVAAFRAGWLGARGE